MVEVGNRTKVRGAPHMIFITKVSKAHVHHHVVIAQVQVVDRREFGGISDDFDPVRIIQFELKQVAPR